jgi:hypothetical protein
MMLAGVSHALVLVSLQQVGVDSAAALRQARQLVLEHYDTITIRAPDERECTGMSLRDCMHGDWSCDDYVCPSDLDERRIPLIEALEDLAPFAGNSEWMFRQRVAFAIRHGEYARAREIASTCSGREAWCMSLRGLTEYLLRPGSGLAQLEFDSALTLASSATRRLPSGDYPFGYGPHARCDWTDIRAVAPIETIAEVQNTSCAEGTEFRDRFWWLADPLWSRAGNLRYVEHVARQALIRTDLDVRQLTTQPSGAVDSGLWVWEAMDIHQAYGHVMRQGFPNSRRITSERTEPRNRLPGSGGYTRWTTSAPYVDGGYSFAPDAKRLKQPIETTAGDWALAWRDVGCSPPWTFERCGPERMITRETWHNLDHQAVVLRRGAQLLVVAASTVQAELGSADQLEPALAAGRIDDLTIRVARATIDSSRVLRASLRVDSSEYIASIEVIGTGHVARARFGAPAPPLDGGFGISDLALVDSGFERDSLTLESALFPSHEFSADAHVGLYFEVYGADEREVIDIAFTTEKTNAGFFERIGRFLRVTSPSGPSEVSWSEPAGDNEPVTRRFLDLDLAALGPGGHRLMLTVRRADGQRATATRTITILE